MASTSSPHGVVPEEVTFPDQENMLHISWSDGHKGVYPSDYLRGACPCAGCKGDHRPINIFRLASAQGVGLIDYRPEGRYAFRFLFSDGHDTGIYNYGYLRALCRCLACTKRRAEA